MTEKSKNWLVYSGLGIQMTVTMVFCLWIGMKIEDYSLIPTPLGQISGIFFGIFSSIYHLIKSVK